MKGHLTILFCFVIILCSCQKELGNSTAINGSGPSTIAGFKAKIDGKQWTAFTYSAARIRNAAQGRGRIVITGHSIDKKILTITLVDSGIHQYSLLPVSSALNLAAYQDSTMANINAYTTNQAFTGSTAAGTTTISKIDTVANTISGTFSFTVYRQMDSTQIVISEGSFTDIPLTSDSPPPANPTIDSFWVKINGSLFTPHSISAKLVQVPGFIIIQAANQAQTKMISLKFPAGYTPGSFMLNVSAGSNIGTYSEGSLSSASVSGILEILEHDYTTMRVRGNFSFLGQQVNSSTPAHQLTEGYFSVVYQ